MRLDAGLAAHLARLPLGHVTREYPHKLDHVWESDADATTPRQQHPGFFGSFDWHSCVHGYWTLATLLRRFPDMPSAPAIRALFAGSLTPSKVAVELDYLSRPMAAGFERPYGWAWLLKLAAELRAQEDAAAFHAITPLAVAFSDRIKRFLLEFEFPYLGESYRCQRSDLIRLGRAHKPDLTDDEAARSEGANQFKVNFDQLKQAWSKNEWIKKNTLIAVAGGEKDGTSVLRDATASFAAQCKNDEGLAHIIFNANPK